MNKSIILLLGLLIFLIPVGPSMSNSNVMAFEDYGYEANQYEQYAMDISNEYNDLSSYGNNNYYDSENPSYKQDYESEYKVYENEKDKSKDRDSSVSIKEINCINTNINTNGDVNIFLGSPGLTGANAEDALTDSLLGNSERYNDGYKKDKHIICDINNNNNNTIVNVNATASGQNIIDTCEECFTENLSFEQEEDLAEFLAPGEFGTLEALCDFLFDETIEPATRQALLNALTGDLLEFIPSETLLDVRNCLIGLGVFT